MMGEGHVMKKAMFITDEGEVHDLMGDLDVDVIDKIDVVKGENGEITVTIDSLDVEGMEGEAKAKFVDHEENLDQQNSAQLLGKQHYATLI